MFKFKTRMARYAMAIWGLEIESNTFTDVIKQVRSSADYILALNSIYSMQHFYNITSQMFSDDVCNQGRLLVWILLSVDTFKKLGVAQSSEMNESGQVRSRGVASIKRSASCPCISSHL